MNANIPISYRSPGQIKYILKNQTFSIRCESFNVNGHFVAESFCMNNATLVYELWLGNEAGESGISLESPETSYRSSDVFTDDEDPSG